MKPLTSEQIRQAVGGCWIRAGACRTLCGVSIDSRACKGGDLFVAIKGERFDGHEFLAQAAGACGGVAMVRRDYRPAPDLAARFEGGIIGVDDTLEALCALGAHHRTQVNARVVAVTGSNGKTTVKRMIDHVLRGKLHGSCSPKSFNNNIGVPLTLLGVNPGDQYVVCEVGSNAPGEIAGLGRICRPDVAVITSVGPTHLEKLLSIEGVAAEKSSLLGEMKPDGVAIVNGDSVPLEQALKRHPDHRVIRFGVGDAYELRLSGYEPLGDGIRFQVNGEVWVELPAPGRHNAMNALAALCVADQFGVGLSDAAEALRDFGGTEMRLQSFDVGGLTVINDAYNANPASVSAAAAVLAERRATRRVMIVGDMRELGGRACELHEQTGREIGARKIDLLIGVGAMGRHIARGAEAAGIGGHSFETVEQAAGALASLLAPGDAVLVKGSRAMAMERLVDVIKSEFGSPGPAQAGRKGAAS